MPAPTTANSPKTSNAAPVDTDVAWRAYTYDSLCPEPKKRSVHLSVSGTSVVCPTFRSIGAEQSGMSDRLHQIVDLLVAAIIAGTSTFIWSFVLPTGLALTLAGMFAAMYYFSRNPWGSPRGEAYNEWIDDLYDRFLP
ncbi:unknown [Haloarcula marismortui ATCC 43049]|uniref:Uncharacterized protein n=2 Tax=Haloarcula marismortui (strain ATCC 43049 / DSM 3752 / JCM 8966 / VKM B-1809) TaxID=272569 RepID=Q5UZS9_HALMA|nr:unknown [Haloarcula marismortui ATCC 43049]